MDAQSTQMLRLQAEKIANAYDLIRELVAKDVNADQCDTLHALYALGETIKSAERTTAEIARRQGISWLEIGRWSGGITKQAAQQRWG